MSRILKFSSALLIVAVLVGTALSQQSNPPAPAKHAGFERLKSLAGVWVATDDKGKPTGEIVSVFKLTAAGTAVHETIFPGLPHEMVTVYHLDGPDLVLTHFCSSGNQPRMKADPKAQENQLRFLFAGGYNLDPKKDVHMHQGSITFLSNDLIDWEWVGWSNGAPVKEHHVRMRLMRRK